MIQVLLTFIIQGQYCANESLFGSHGRKLLE